MSGAESLREWLLFAPLLGLMALTFIAEGEVRYRIPFDGLLIILAAKSLLDLLRWLASFRNDRRPQSAKTPARLYPSAFTVNESV